MTKDQKKSPVSELLPFGGSSRAPSGVHGDLEFRGIDGAYIWFVKLPPYITQKQGENSNSQAHDIGVLVRYKE